MNQGFRIKHIQEAGSEELALQNSLLNRNPREADMQLSHTDVWERARIEGPDGMSENCTVMGGSGSKDAIGSTWRIIAV